MNCVTLNAVAKNDLLFNKQATEMGFLDIYIRLKQDNKVRPNSLQKLYLNCATPKATAKHELLYNKLALVLALLDI
jgi:hypothetical protein